VTDWSSTAQDVGVQAGKMAMSQLVSARLVAATEPPEEITCRINPNEFSIQKSANLHTDNQVGDVKEGMTTYNGPSPSTLSVSLLFDDTGLSGAVGVVQSVPVCVAMLLSWTEPTPASELVGPPMPPIVDFSWGATQHFLGNVESVQVSYKLFRLGVPVRAEVSLTMRSISTPLPMTNPTSGGLVPRKSRVVVEGDSLASIAHRTYGKAAAWRSVAEVNGIDDPSRLRIGAELLLPDRSEVELPRR
jgi:nucleoid-associated protein YgaU